MTSGMTYATTPMRISTAAESIAMRSRRSRHHARRYGPAERGSAGRRFRSATTAETTCARAMSGGRSDLGVDEAIRDVHKQIRDDVRAGGEQDDPLHERVVLLQDRVDRQLPDALPREDGLDDDASREEPPDLQTDDGDDRDERVPQRVAQHEDARRQALRPRRRHVLPSQ